MLKKSALVLSLCLLIAGIGPAQTTDPETTATVPELTSFHDVIAPIWHDAYPKKDYAALRGFVPKINELAAKVYEAKLPGILRDKEAKWKEGLAAFKASVDAYNAAAAGTDDPALLTAAEALHARYEAMVRLIRPLLAELDAFHKVLYGAVHTYAPEKQYDKIRGVSADLLAKAEAAAAAALPARLAAKADAYKAAAAALVASAKALKAAADAHDHDGMIECVDDLHAKYRAVEKIFE